MDRASIVNAIRRPSSAAVAGLVFSTTLGTVVVLLHSASPPNLTDAGQWVDDESRLHAVSVALGLLPFTGIAFLWFIAVARAMLGSREDRFFETAFIGSGLLFVATLFVSAAALAGVVTLVEAGASPAGLATYSWVFAAALLGEFGTRMAAIFTLAMTTAAWHAASIPRWLALSGYATGLVLLITPPLPTLTQFAFPAWVAAVSLRVLFARSITTQPA